MTLYYCSHCDDFFSGDEDHWWCPVCHRNGQQVSNFDEAGDYDLSQYNRDE